MDYKPPGQQFVAIDLVCRTDESHRLLRVMMQTFDGADRVLLYKRPTSEGVLQLDRHVGRKDKFVLHCRACRTEVQLTQEKLEQALNAMWRPRRHAVVRMPV